MKGAILALSFLALCTTLSLAQVGTKSHGKMVLTTAQGKTVFTDKYLGTVADLEAGKYSFYFKIPEFTSGNKATDKDLFKVLDADNYGTLAFDGTFAEKLARPTPGKNGTVKLTGTMTYQGRKVPTEITAATSMQNGRVVIEASFPLSPTGTELAKAAAKKMGVTKPIVLTITAAY